MPARIESVGEVVTAYLSGELDHHSAKEMRTAIDNAVELNMPSLLILDFSDITFMDSSGVGLVMGRYRNLMKRNAQLNIICATEAVYKMLRLAGIERIAQLERVDKNESNK